MTRVAGIIAPFVGEALMQESTRTPLYLFAACDVLCALCALALPFDTTTRKLRDTLDTERDAPDEEGETAPLVKGTPKTAE